jgi:hypothetical protein
MPKNKNAKNAKRRKFYLHTIDGQPAAYSKEEGQIHYGLGKIDLRKCPKDLGQVRREQQASEEWRLAQGYDAMDYDYVILYL